MSNSGQPDGKQPDGEQPDAARPAGEQPDTESPPVMKRSIFRRLYHGETNFDFIGRTKRWFALSGAVIVIGLLGLGIRGGLNLGIDFEGGNQYTVAANGVSVQEATDTIEGLGFTGVGVQTVGDNLRVQTETVEGSDRERQARNQEVVRSLTRLTGVTANEIDVSEVGPSWGREISSKALRALAVFLVAIGIYITIRFELRMAIATLVALVHDILVVVGVYAVLQLPVTPATVIAVLTILGFSIYDGIVVFDRVDENTRLLSSGGRTTYSAMVNDSLNQVLMRSLNTQVTAILPILSVLIVGSLALGATTLQEFGLALFVGQLSGAYSSIFIASPVLALLKEREPRYQALRKRLGERDDRLERKAAARSGPAAASDADVGIDATPAAGATSTGARTPTSGKAPARTASTATRSSSAPSSSGTRSHPPRPRKKGRRR